MNKNEILDKSDINKNVKTFSEEKGFKYIKDLGSWEEYQVFEAYEDSHIRFYILVEENNHIRMATLEEANRFRKFKVSSNELKCPNCGSTELLKYLYGEPPYNYDKEKFILGGCIITGKDPQYKCKKCNKDLFLDYYSNLIVEKNEW